MNAKHAPHPFLPLNEEPATTKGPDNLCYTMERYPNGKPIKACRRTMNLRQPANHPARAGQGEERLTLHQWKKRAPWILPVHLLVLDDGIQTAIYQGVFQWLEHFKNTHLDTGASFGMNDPGQLLGLFGRMI